MKNYIGVCTAAIFLSVLPGTALAQRDAGIPPMLETQRPLAMPANQQPEPRAPQPDLAKPVAQATPVEKTKKVAPKKCTVGKTNLASQKKTIKTVKKKGANVKPRSKVAASNS